MGESEVNHHERLKQKLSELEQEWTAMNTSKSSPPRGVSWLTVEEALEFVKNSPRELMLSLQDNQECPEAAEKMIQIRSPHVRRKLFQDPDDDDDDDDDEIKAASFSHSSCWSSNEIRVRDNDSKKTEKKSGRIVFVSMVLILLLVLVVLMNDFGHLFMNTPIDTLVPT